MEMHLYQFVGFIVPTRLITCGNCWMCRSAFRIPFRIWFSHHREIAPMKSLLRGVKKRSAVVPRPLLVISSAVALSLLGDQMLYAVLPAVHEAVGVPVTAVGLLLSANRLIRLLTNSLAGYVIERFGRHWPFVLALLLGGITTVAYGVVYGVWAFLVARLLWGTAWSFIRIEGMSTALDVASEETRGRYMGLFQAISRIGSAIALLAGGIFAVPLAFAPHLSCSGRAPALRCWRTSRGVGGAPRAYLLRYPR